jgi:putative transposase
MARIARVVAPGYPHHITQRGNRRQTVFFSDEDYVIYKSLMAAFCARHGVEIWAYCLMPNHVHMIAVPKEKDSLRAAIGEAHRRYTRLINFRENWRGYLWQGRFSSFVMQERYCIAAARYIELNPVRAGLVATAREWPWSSACAHLDAREDSLLKPEPLLRIVKDWNKILREGEAEIEAIRSHARTGRPWGTHDFIARLESQLKRTLKKEKPGPKKQINDR